MIDDQVCQYVGADYWLKDAMAGVRLCQSLLAADGITMQSVILTNGPFWDRYRPQPF